jgi:hypothetical protein
MPALVRAGVLGGARPLSIPSGGQDEEEVVRRCVVLVKRGRERSWSTTRFSAWPRSVRLRWAMVVGLVFAWPSWVA